MKKRRFTEQQIVGFLQEAEARMLVQEVQMKEPVIEPLLRCRGVSGILCKRVSVNAAASGLRIG